MVDREHEATDALRRSALPEKRPSFKDLIAQANRIADKELNDPDVTDASAAMTKEEAERRIALQERIARERAERVALSQRRRNR
jgi:hypothetical protein